MLLLYHRSGYNINKLRSDYVRWIDRIFTIHPKSSTNLVRFRVAFDLPSFFSGFINYWVSSALSRKVESLDLILNTYSYSPEECYYFPYHKGNFPDNMKLKGNFPDNMKLLKKLSLHCVNVSDAAVAFLLENCSLLEQLSLSRCGNMLSSLEVGGTLPVFKCLEISQCPSLSSVVVCDSNIVCVKYAGLGRPHCRFKLVGRLTQLWIRAAHAQEMQSFSITNIRGIIDMFDSVLPQLHTLKIYCNFKITCNDTLQRMMPNLKELVVVVQSEYSDNCSLMPIISWFSVAPCLERFVLEASHQDKTNAEINLLWGPKMDYLINGSNDDVSEINNSNEVQWAYSHIKEVEFFGYRGVRNHLQMVSRLVRHGVALEKIVVDPRSFELRENMPWDRISQNQMEDEIIARKLAKK